MKKNTAKEKLRAGKPAVGSWLSLCSPMAAEYVAQIGFDWLVVDTEHSPVGFETTIEMFRAVHTTPTIPMARVAWNDAALIKRLLDGGAMGLVVPMVCSPEEAEAAVKAMKYPPEGIRSAGGGRATVYGADYMQWANDEMLVVVMIEHIDAVKRAREILSVPGVDACFIGPGDLSWSMGLRGKLPNADHEAAIQEVLKAGKDVGTPVGLHCMSAADVNNRIEQGFQFLAMASEARYMNAAMTAAFKELKLS
jgi:4-hydroxy-2-oxoheptanedioate aldolase